MLNLGNVFFNNDNLLHNSISSWSIKAYIHSHTYVISMTSFIYVYGKRRIRVHIACLPHTCQLANTDTFHQCHWAWMQSDRSQTNVVRTLVAGCCSCTYFIIPSRCGCILYIHCIYKTYIILICCNVNDSICTHKMHLWCGSIICSMYSMSKKHLYITQHRFDYMRYKYIYLCMYVH